MVYENNNVILAMQSVIGINLSSVTTRCIVLAMEIAKQKSRQTEHDRRGRKER